MKPVKYALLMIALLLSPIKLMSMTEDEARDYIKEFISKQQDFGKHDETLKLTFANINIDDNGVKVIFNKEDDVFNPLFPELTEGKFKTVAQENRYVNHQFGLYFLMREAIKNPKFLDALKDSNISWDVFVMNPRQNVPYYTTSFGYRDVANAMLINNNDENTDFKTFLSISLVDRALKSLMEQVYIPHDSIGISYARLSQNVLKCTMLTTSDSYPKITGGLSAADYIVQQIGGTKQKDKDLGLFMQKYGDVVTQMKRIAEINADKSRRVYEVVDEMPEFPGGTLALSNYLTNQVNYPTVALQNKIQGRVICEFVITNEGKVTNVKIAEPTNPLLDAEAKRVITSMPNWIPGRNRGERVNTKYSVPVTFTLPN